MNDMTYKKKLIITTAVISLSTLLLFVLYMYDYSLSSLKYRNPKMDGLLRCSKSIEQSKDVDAFIEQLHIDKDQVQINDSLVITFGDCWIERTWISPKAFKKIEFCNEYNDRYSIIIQFYKNIEESGDWYIKTLLPAQENGYIRRIGNPYRFQAFHSSIEDTFYYEIFQRIVYDTCKKAKEVTIEQIKLY